MTIHILFDHMICHFYLPMGDFKPMTFVSLDLGVNELPSALPCHLCLFPFFSQVNDRYNIIFHHSNCKSIDVVLRMQTQDGSSRRIHWTNAQVPNLKPTHFFQSKIPFITNYRSSMLVVTAVCILGVDFPVFPRRFAKTETFGFGLMDIGVGSFIFASGLVSQEARKGLQKLVSKYFLTHRFGQMASIHLCSIPLIVTERNYFHHCDSNPG